MQGLIFLEVNQVNKKNKKYQLNYLSTDFYNKYNSVDYPEIENKANRPYMVMLIKIENNTFAIPFRTNIKHNSCYKFKNSSRQTNSTTGLDYTKAVIVNDNKYIGEAARVNDLEYIELDANYHIITKQFTSFVKGYIKFAQGKLNKFQATKYRYTTLKYFENDLLHKSVNQSLEYKINDAQVRFDANKQTTTSKNNKSKETTIDI